MASELEKLIAQIDARVQSGVCDLRDVGKQLTGKWDQDAPAALIAAAKPASAPPPEAVEANDWRDDPAMDDRWSAGLDYGLTQLCSWLGVDQNSVSFDAATETLDGDVQAVIGNILRAKFGDDFDFAALAAPLGGVKALEWRKPARADTLSRADTIIGIYRVWTHTEANGRWFWGMFDHGQNFGFDQNNNEYSSEDEAKAAAQADYERRIRSALTGGGT